MTDPEFLEDIDEGRGNFLIPSLIRLKRYYEKKEDDCENFDDDLLSKFRHVLSAKFPQKFSFRPSFPTITRIRSNSDDDYDDDDDDNNANKVTGDNMDIDMDDYDDDDDEDGPVMVSSEDIEASLARSSSYAATAATSGGMTNTDVLQLRRDYPLLAAAVMPREDVLMTCARALDEKTDVSLVREAAAYLEEVEQ